jgi:AcrR family transcriptional regulator
MSTTTKPKLSVVRQPLSRERVLSAAIGLADEAGLDAVSMRRLAHRLGVEAMSLYHHVRNKDEILAGMVEAVIAEIELPQAGRPWKAAIRRFAVSAYETYARHPWAAPLSLRGRLPGEARMAYMDAVLGSLSSAGLSETSADLAYHVLESHIMGFTLWEGAMQLGDPSDLARAANAFLDRVPADRFPHLVDHIHQHLRPRPADAPGAFTFGLDLLLDGIERQAAAEA